MFMSYNIKKHELNTARPGKKNLNLITEYLNNILCVILYNYLLFFFQKNKRFQGTIL